MEVNEVYSAKNLRFDNGIIIPSLKGIYFWYAKKEHTKSLLKEYFENIIPFLHTIVIENEVFYLIYLWISEKENGDLYKRIVKRHLNDKHDYNAIKNKTLSTLRQSISSLLFANQNTKEKANEFLDKLYVSFIVCDNPKIKEKEYLDKYIVPLNIKWNSHFELKEFKVYLKKSRKEAREKALEELE